MQQVKDILKQLHAIETLEYYNKNYLTENRHTMNKMKRQAIEDAIQLIEDEEEEPLPF